MEFASSHISVLEGIRIVLLPRNGKGCIWSRAFRDDLGAEVASRVAAASSFVEFAGMSALDAVGDERSDDRKGN